MTRALIPTSQLSSSMRVSSDDILTRLAEKGVRPIYEKKMANGKVWRQWDEKQARQALIDWQADLVAARKARQAVAGENNTKMAAKLTAKVDDDAAKQLATMVVLMTEMIKNQQELMVAIATLRDEHGSLAEDVTALMATITAPTQDDAAHGTTPA